MENGSFLDGGDTRPLLCEEASEEMHKGDVSLDFGGRPSHSKISDWRAPAIILGFEFLESLGYCGIAINLVIYLSSVLHESNASIAADVTTWTGTSFLAPFLGALIADSYWGSYRMIFFSCLVFLLGMITITLSASLPSLKPPPCEENSCPSATEAQELIFYSGLYLIAFGSGGVKSSLLPLGADQFNDDNPRDRQRKCSFFNWFYFCMNCGALVSSTLIVWIQVNVDWAVGYGIATLCMAQAVGIFLCGASTYRLQKPGGSPIKKAFQVLIASFRKLKVQAPTDSSLLYEMPNTNHEIPEVQRLAHTDSFRFLDKAATISHFDMKEGISPSSWRLCTVTQVEELKMLLRLFPIWVTSIIYSVSYAQMSTTFVEQGRAMDSRIGAFNIPPASLYSFEVLSVMLWVLLYDSVITSVARSYLGNGFGLTLLQRMGTGYFFMILAMATAAIVEVKRLNSVDAGIALSIMWQLPQYFVIAGSEVFTYIGQLEFFYDQGPDSMRNVSTAISLLAISLGNYLSSLIVTLVASMTASGDQPGWIPDDLNEGHLDYFFLLLAGLGALTFVAYLDCARKFTWKKIVSGCCTK